MCYEPDYEEAAAEDAFEKAAEAWALERFGSYTDWYYWVLDQVPPERREKLIREIHEVLDFFDTEGEFKLTWQALAILHLLNDSRTTMVQVEIEAGLSPTKTPVSRKTIGIILAKLYDRGLVKYPHGPNKGVAITPKGSRYLTP